RVSETRLSFLVRTAPDEVRQGLEPFGYYDAVVTPEVIRDGDKVTVRLAVVPGEPVRVRTLDVGVSAPGAEDEAVVQRLANFSPRVGDVFHSGVYEINKAGIARALGEHGYFDTELRTHRVNVSRADRAADIALSWDTGERYRLGPVTFEGQQLRAGVIDPLVPWESGEPFEQRRLLELQQSLLDTDFFSSISLQPEPEKAIDHVVPITVTLVPAKRSVYNLGLRYGTDSGAGINARLERRWLNNRGHKLLLDLNIAQYKSNFTAQYKIPAFRWLDGWLTYQASLREEQIQDLTTQTVDVSVNRSGRWRGWNLLAGLNYTRERADSIINDRHDYYTVVYPSVWGQWKTSDEVNSPRRALGLTVEVRGGSASLGSDVDFLQMRAEGRWIRGFGATNRVLLRGELGTTVVDDFTRLPPSLRFYAGGDHSVRGYGYKEIGTVDGELFGGKHLAVASAEFEHMFTPVWGAAVFVDAGDAFDDNFDAHIGFGAGLRWRSPVGPVRVDIASDVSEDDPGLRLHISVGPDL
ncbi:MAG: autotransporter assembly complex protein TamA, partial [Gammaproteobacteria bacterium]|nr:autotransporter assembly complex protein TamA [Gammaproteobacteria bacterium]